jgi:hypothetical protein
VRAAYAALILGVVAGAALATGVLSGRGDPGPTTVAGILALDEPGIDRDRRRADAVAMLAGRCMLTRGHAWTPWPEPPPPIPDAELDAIGWAERWGFGVSTMVGRPVASASVDPNLRTIAAMAPDGREAYREALDGPHGCRTDATDRVYGLRERALSPIRASLLDLDARIAASDAAERATGRWRDCVRPLADGDGHDVQRRTLPTELRDRFARRLAALARIPGLVALQVEERRVAAALARCDIEYDAARALAAAPFEAAYVAERRAALEAISAEIRAGEAALPSLPP